MTCERTRTCRLKPRVATTDRVPSRDLRNPRLIPFGASYRYTGRLGRQQHAGKSDRQTRMRRPTDRTIFSVNQRAMYGQTFVAELAAHGLVTAALLAIAGYCLAVRTQTSTLFCKDGKFKQFLIENVPVVTEKYLPSVFGFHGYVHTILATIFRSLTIPSIVYEREILTLKDGGEVAIDWLCPNSGGPQNVLTVVILPGLTGDSQTNYIRETVNDLFKKGYCCVVLNYRGRGGVKLKTARAYSGNNTEDLTEVLIHVKSNRPNSPVAGIGFSMGGLLLGSFLMSREQVNHKFLVAGVMISVPWNVTKACGNAERTWLMRKMSGNLARALRSVIVENKDVVFDKDNNDSNLDYDTIKQCNTIREFDTAYTIKMFDYTDAYQYYEDVSLNNKLHLINVPCLCLSAADDPFLYLKDIPMAEADRHSNFAILVTSVGGHVGHLDTFWPFTSNGFMLKFIRQYFDAIGADKNYERFVNPTSFNMKTNSILENNNNEY